MGSLEAEEKNIVDVMARSNSTLLSENFISFLTVDQSVEEP